MATVKKEKTMLEQLRKFNADQTNLEDTIALAAFARTLRSEYEVRQLTTPEWFDDCYRRINRAVESQTADRRELRLKQIAAEKAKLKTPTERRAELEAEEAALLGKA